MLYTSLISGSTQNLSFELSGSNHLFQEDQPEYQHKCMSEGFRSFMFYPLVPDIYRLDQSMK